jgi:hypothetical protein
MGTVCFSETPQPTTTCEPRTFHMRAVNLVLPAVSYCYETCCLLS